MSDESRERFPSEERPWLKYYVNHRENIQDDNKTVYEYFCVSNRNNLTGKALHFLGKSISYKKFIEKIKKTVMGLHAFGIKKGDVVTIQCLLMPQIIYIYYALSYIGAVGNFLLISDNAEQVHEQLFNTKSKLYIVQDYLYDKMKACANFTDVKGIITMSLDSEAGVVSKIALQAKKSKCYGVYTWHDLLNFGKNFPAENKNPYLPVVMLHTSGTTGISKTVILSNRAVNALAQQYKACNINIIAQEKFLTALPPFVAFGLIFGIHVPLCMGLQVYIEPNPAPNLIGKYFAKYKPNYLIHGILGISNLMANPKVRKMDLSFVKVLGLGGETIPRKVELEVNQFLKNHNSNASVSIGYGMTETCSTAVTSVGVPYKFGAAGIPLCETNVKIVEHGTCNELSYNQVGEVCLNTICMMEGYFNNQEETQNVIKQHSDSLLWMHTGDMGYIDEDGYVFIIGRYKRMITVYQKEMYHKVFPVSIEDRLAKADKVNSIVVVARKTEELKNELVAFGVPESNSNLSVAIQKLELIAESELEPWERPKEYIWLENLPRTKLGKIDFKLLEEMAIEKEKILSLRK